MIARANFIKEETIRNEERNTARVFKLIDHAYTTDNELLFLDMYILHRDLVDIYLAMKRETLEEVAS